MVCVFWAVGVGLNGVLPSHSRCAVVVGGRLTWDYSCRYGLLRYFALCRVEHPDKRASSGSKYTEEQAIERMQLLGEAYAVLSDVDARREYDATYSAAFFRYHQQTR